MATLDEIFASMPDEAASGTHELLVIDPDTRQIYIPDVEEIFGVEHDGNAETKYFQCPRYVGKGIDLAACFLRINFQNANGERDGYLVSDTTVEGEYIYFSWELSPKVTQYQGSVQFVLCASLPGSTKTNDWHTTLAQGKTLEGLEPDAEAVAAASSDVIAQLLALVAVQSDNVEAVGAAQVANVQAEGKTQVAAVQTAAAQAEAQALEEIEAKKQNVLEQIPDDYTAMADQVDTLTRSTAGAIVCQADGTTIQVADASNHPLPGLRIFGRSTQDGTPTPDNPVEIVSTPAPVVIVCGVNLVKNELTARTIAGVTFTVNDDGSVTANGTSTELVQAVICGGFLFRAGVRYKLTGCPAGGGKDSYRIDNTDKLADDGNGGLTEYSTDTVLPIRIRIAAGVTVNNLTFFPMLHFASIDCDTYKPYTGSSVTLVNVLPGIPVAYGGNYTDADGQAWICDEVDLGRGVYVRRTVTHTFTSECRIVEWNGEGGVIGINITGLPYDNTPTDEARAVCSHFTVRANGTAIGESIGVRLLGDSYRFYILNTEKITTMDEWKDFFDEQANNGTPVKILLPAAEITETPLSEAELAAFAALRSVKPCTTILNDSGAHMAVEYVADTKLYIDRKLAELIAALNA